jgi:membrane-bound inhibitor of C-type lysozyme
MKFIHFAKTGLGIVLAASLAGCGGFNFSFDSLNPWRGPVERARTTPADATEYACEGAKRLVVRHLPGGNAVMIVFQEREFRLDQAPSASSTSGARFTNGSTTLQSQGDQVSLEEEGAVTYSNCRKAAR